MKMDQNVDRDKSRQSFLVVFRIRIMILKSLQTVQRLSSRHQEDQAANTSLDHT